MRTINHWINGRTVDTQPERTGAVYDPATGQQAAQVAYPTGDDVDAAVRAPHAASPPRPPPPPPTPAPPPAPPGWARHLGRQAGPGHVRLPRPAREAPR